MKIELQERLFTAFPRLYADRNASFQESLMAFGLEVGDGWFDILWRLSEALEAEINALPPSDDLPRAVQVKEKYGEIRVYLSSETDTMTRAIEQAEAESAITCESCGLRGTLRGTHWVITLCDLCEAEKRRT